MAGIIVIDGEERDYTAYVMRCDRDVNMAAILRAELRRQGYVERSAAIAWLDSITARARQERVDAERRDRERRTSVVEPRVLLPEYVEHCVEEQ